MSSGRTWGGSPRPTPGSAGAAGCSAGLSRRAAGRRPEAPADPPPGRGRGRAPAALLGCPASRRLLLFSPSLEGATNQLPTGCAKGTQVMGSEKEGIRGKALPWLGVCTPLLVPQHQKESEREGGVDGWQKRNENERCTWCSAQFGGIRDGTRGRDGQAGERVTRCIRAGRWLLCAGGSVRSCASGRGGGRDLGFSQRSG